MKEIVLKEKVFCGNCNKVVDYEIEDYFFVTISCKECGKIIYCELSKKG